nr:MAG TPA: hypothetical protein [Crassvirales sp.]
MYLCHIEPNPVFRAGCNEFLKNNYDRRSY